jgi:hypothetical protein
VRAANGVDEYKGFRRNQVYRRTRANHLGSNWFMVTPTHLLKARMNGRSAV